MLPIVLSKAAINPMKKIGNATKVVKALPPLSKSKIPVKSFAPYGSISTAKIIEKIHIGKIVSREAFTNPLRIAMLDWPEENLCQFIGLVICKSVLITITLAMKTMIRSFGRLGNAVKEAIAVFHDPFGVLNIKKEDAITKPIMIIFTCMLSV